MPNELDAKYDPETNRYTPLDCGDSSCLFVRPERRTGMRTNGGCRCLKDHVPAKLMSRIHATWQHLQRDLRDAQQQLATLRKEAALAHLSNSTERIAELEAENAELRDQLAGQETSGVCPRCGKHVPAPGIHTCAALRA